VESPGGNAQRVYEAERRISQRGEHGRELAGTDVGTTQRLAAGPFQRTSQHLGCGVAAAAMAGDRLMSGVGQVDGCEQAGQAASEEGVEGAARRDES
jgi:hypothetical protein